MEFKEFNYQKGRNGLDFKDFNDQNGISNNIIFYSYKTFLVLARSCEAVTTIFLTVGCNFNSGACYGLTPRTLIWPSPSA